MVSRAFIRWLLRNYVLYIWPNNVCITQVLQCLRWWCRWLSLSITSIKTFHTFSKKFLSILFLFNGIVFHHFHNFIRKIEITFKYSDNIYILHSSYRDIVIVLLSTPSSSSWTTNNNSTKSPYIFIGLDCCFWASIHPNIIWDMPFMKRI